MKTMQPNVTSAPAQTALPAAAPLPAHTVEHREKQKAIAARLAPRFAAGAVPVSSDPTVAPKGASWLACARPVCGARLDLSACESTDGRDRFIEAHGFVKRTLKGEEHLYCSAHCHAMEADLAAERIAHARAGDRLAAEKYGPPTKINAKDGWLTCDQARCDARLEVGPPEVSLRAAAAQGFVQGRHGVFCGMNCAKRATADVNAGLGTKSHPGPGLTIERMKSGAPVADVPVAPAVQ